MIGARFHRETLTHIELIWHEQQIEHWIRFGRDVAEQILDRRRRVLSFAPNSIVAYVRWASGDFGTIVSRIDILRTVRRGEGFSTVPYVRPGGEILLRVSGWPKVERVLQAIDAVEQIGIDAADACPDHWRHVHNRLAAGEVPRPYSRERIARGSCAGRSTRDAPRLDHAPLRARRRCVDAAPSCPAADLECQRQRADRPLCGASDRRPSRRRAGPGQAAGSPRVFPRRSAAIWRWACRS